MKRPFLVTLIITTIVLSLILAAGAAAILYDEMAYVSLRYAHNVAAGRGLLFDKMVSGYAPALPSPLFVLLLAGIAFLTPALQGPALLLSAGGWLVTALALVAVSQTQGRLMGGFLTAVLLVMSPPVVAALGTHLSWTAAWVWLAIAFSLRQQWRAQTAVSLLLLCTQLDVSTILFVVFLWGWQWRARPQAAWVPGLILIAGIGGLSAWMGLVFGSQALIPPFDWSGYGFLRNHLSIFFVPLLGVGLFARQPLPVWLGLAWAIGSGQPVMVVVFLLFWVGASLSVLRPLVMLSRPQLAGFVGGPLAALLLILLWQQVEQRPMAVAPAVADWLQAHSAPTDTLLASPAVGYLADRPLWANVTVAAAQTTPELLTWLALDPPDYLLLSPDMAGQLLQHTGWFQARYKQVAQFQAADAVWPTKVWAYQTSPFDAATRQPLAVQTDQGIDVVGYAYAPERLQPGEAIYVTLYMQATQPLSRTFQTVVRLVSPVDRAAWAQRDQQRPISLPVSWWQPGQIVAERFVLTTTADIPIGAYDLNVSWYNRPEERFWPLVQGTAETPVDRVHLGYVGVPWSGEVEADIPISAQFGDQFQLVGANVIGPSAPDSTITVRLYWQALGQPQARYMVFVHLLDEQGALVTTGDGPPLDGRFPTDTWLPGETFPDSHTLALPADLPAGRYTIAVGFYLLETGDRLPVWDEAGQAQVNDALQLTTIEVP